MFNSCFHDDINIGVLGEHDDSLGRGFIDIVHQFIQHLMDLGSILGEVTWQDIDEFNADVLHYSEIGLEAITAILPVLIITSHNGYCCPVELPHQLRNGLCLMFITGYCSQKRGELQLPAQLLTSRSMTYL